MELFPFILLRKAALPFEKLRNLQWQNHFILEKRIAQEKKLKLKKEEILENLKSLRENITDYSLKVYLGNLSKDIFNNRTIRLDKIVKRFSNETDSISILQKLQSYLRTKMAFQNTILEFEKHYVKETADIRFELKKFTQHDLLRKGLLFSSHGMMNRLDAYQKRDLNAFRKKEFQIERTLLQYLSRMTAKTSPFSTFTQLGMIDWKNRKNEKEDITIKSHVRLNNLLFSFFQETLCVHFPFYKNLEISVNPSIRKEKENFVFLYNVRNIESIQRLEQNEILFLLLDEFEKNETSFVFSNLVELLLKHVDASIDVLEQYIHELVQLGFLQWQWNIPGTDPFWNRKLKQKIESFPSFEIKEELLEILNILEEQSLKYALAKESKRVDVLNYTFEKLHLFSKRFLDLLNENSISQELNIEEFKGFGLPEFIFRKEEIFFEDTTQNMLIEFDSKIKSFDSKFDSLIEQLNKLTKNLLPFQKNVLKHSVKSFFLDHFSKEDEIDLLLFYEHFYKKNSDKNAQHISPTLETSKWIDSFLEKAKKQEDEIDIKLSDMIEEVKSIFPFFDLAAPLNNSFAAMLQIYEEDGILKTYCDAAFMGYGKMLGRFLHLFPKEIITIQIQNNATIFNKNKNLPFDQVWVENTDASFYNANLHPVLFEHEIAMPGGHNNLPTEKQIKISDLKIIYHEPEDRLILKNGDKEVKVFDMGFEAIASRSSMYQLLSCFNIENPSLVVLQHELFEKTKKIGTNGIIRSPRISINQQLIVQRRTWHFPKSQIPFKEKNESNASYFIRIQAWKNKYTMPDFVFIKIKEKRNEEKTIGNKNDYKPQFIQFLNPTFIQLFAKMIKRVESVMQVAEMLPVPDAYAKEYIVQWEN